MLRVGVDVGGTFTDVVALDLDSFEVRRAKAHTTPGRIVDGQMAALRALRVDLSAARTLFNATTVVTNAILTRSGAPTALLMTAGFADALETGRERRVGGGLHMYDLRQSGPAPLVPRFLCFELAERIAADGRVLSPLDEEQVRTVARRLSALGVRSVAVCCLFSYLNPRHERRVRELLLEVNGRFSVALSCEIAPEIREYERACTTYLDAYTRVAFEDYASGLSGELAALASRPEIFLMQSNGGLAPMDRDTVRPVGIVESGPAAGVVAAGFVGRAAGFADLVAFDVGGTTAKATLLRDGQPAVSPEFKVEGFFPIKAAAIDLVEIGTGGGSIGWIDEGGALRVGPQSAGADPGPVAYGRGGHSPTLTDANLVLGRIDHQRFLGGGLALDPALAEEAIRHAIAQPLGLSVIEAAEGMVTIANAQMASAIRLISTRRGLDPRDFVVVAYGGGGPLHAVEIAAEIGFSRVLVPEGAATFSALGLLVGDLQSDVARSFMTGAPDADAARIERAFVELEARALQGLGRRADANVATERALDVRYAGQRWELRIPARGGPFDPVAWQQVSADFHAAHERAYRFHDVSRALEVTCLRVRARAPMPKPRLRAGPPVADGGHAVAVRTRRIVSGGREVAARVYARADLKPGHMVDGPAMVEEADTALWIPSGSRARMDGLGNCIVNVGGRS